MPEQRKFAYFKMLIPRDPETCWNCYLSTRRQEQHAAALGKAKRLTRWSINYTIHQDKKIQTDRQPGDTAKTKNTDTIIIIAMNFIILTSAALFCSSAQLLLPWLGLNNEDAASQQNVIEVTFVGTRECGFLCFASTRRWLCLDGELSTEWCEILDEKFLGAIRLDPGTRSGDNLQILV